MILEIVFKPLGHLKQIILIFPMCIFMSHLDFLCEM